MSPICTECGRPGYSAEVGGVVRVVGHLDQRIKHSFSQKPVQAPMPFSPDEIAAFRKWHRKVPGHPPKCAQGELWPCRHSRFLVTLDAQSNPAQVAKFYREWNDRLEAETPIASPSPADPAPREPA